MGTNYYLVRNRASVMEPIHIGKSSCGWLFNFQDQDERWCGPPVVWRTYPQVKDALKRLTVDSDEYAIVNEYDEIIPYGEFIAMVDAKQSDPHNINNPDNFRYRTKNIDGYRFTEGDFS